MDMHGNRPAKKSIRRGKVHDGATCASLCAKRRQRWRGRLQAVCGAMPQRDEETPCAHWAR
eukprot:9485420-Pyramimonas_sp.AAC.1